MDEKTMENFRFFVEKGLVGRQELDEAANTKLVQASRLNPLVLTDMAKDSCKKYLVQARRLNPQGNKNDDSRESDWREMYKEAAKKLLALGYKADDIKKMFL